VLTRKNPAKGMGKGQGTHGATRGANMPLALALRDGASLASIPPKAAHALSCLKAGRMPRRNG
jgi:hypothetical protein